MDFTEPILCEVTSVIYDFPRTKDNPQNQLKFVDYFLEICLIRNMLVIVFVFFFVDLLQKWFDNLFILLMSEIFFQFWNKQILHVLRVFSIYIMKIRVSKPNELLSFLSQIPRIDISEHFSFAAILICWDRDFHSFPHWVFENFI